MQGQPPAISQNGVTNLASKIPSSLVDAAIAPGEAFSIQGVRLGTDTANTHLKLELNGRLIPIPARSVRPNQIQAVMPGRALLGPGSLIVETPDGPSKPFPVRVVAAQPGLYAVNGQGWGQGQIQMTDATGGRQLNGIEDPIRRGGTATIDATGLGRASSAELVIGGIAVQALGIQHSGEPGVDRIRFRVSRSVPQGCFVPVYLRTGSARPSNVVSMAIQDRGSTCELPADLPHPGSRLGLLSIARMDALYSDASPLTTMEQAFAAFYASNAADQSQNPLLSGPPDGTCTAFYGDAQSQTVSLTSLGDLLGRSLQGRGFSVGRSLLISGSRGVRVIPASPGEPGAYSVRLGLEEPGSPPAPPLFLNDARFRVSWAGAEIGPSEREIAGPPSFEWLNRTELATIERSRGASFQWRGVPQDARVLVVATAANSVGTAGGACLCAADARSGRLTIPGEMLANFPASNPHPGPPVNMVYLIAFRVNSDSTDTVKGLDRILALSIYATGRRVTYR